MNICVYGIWHLGAVTAACLAEAGHRVIGLEPDAGVVHNLQAGIPPLFEPELQELLQQGLASGNLQFTTQLAKAFAPVDLVWVTFDTPVDDNDQADVHSVIGRVEAAFPFLKPDTLVLISSQLPVGTTAHLEQSFARLSSPIAVSFAYSPENLRLGKAVQIFRHSERIVVGIRGDRDRARLRDLLAAFTDRIEWMTVESAEMTKHALNAFLATEVAFMNELAVLCERLGADAEEVERGLKSEPRIGPHAYLRPGAAFAGGTLARDLAFLEKLSLERGLPAHLFQAVMASNNAHQNWSYERLGRVLGGLEGKTVAVLGLTYKPGTSTLRRSAAVELCRQLRASQARVQAYDPQAEPLPADLAAKVLVSHSLTEALRGADAAVIATEWPEFRSISAELCCEVMRQPIVIDPNRFLGLQLGADPRIQHHAVGQCL